MSAWNSGVALVAALLAASCSSGSGPIGGVGGGSSTGGGEATGGGSGAGGSGGGVALVAPPPQWAPQGTRVTWNGVSFIVPPGMTGTDQTSRYDLIDMGSGGINTCGITINAPVAASGDLAQQANDILVQGYMAQGYQVLDDNYGTNLIGNRTQGRSPKGWDWVELRAELRKTGPSPERGHILLVGLGSQVVPILGYSPENDGCTQLAHDNTAGIIGELRWRQLAYSLDFSGLTASAVSVVGQWSLFQANSGQEYVFAANGRYQHWGGLTTAHQISSTEIELVTSSFTGDGAWKVEGDVLALFPDGRAPEAYLFRVFEHHSISATGVVRKDVKLGLMKQDVAGPYELAVIKH